MFVSTDQKNVLQRSKGKMTTITFLPIMSDLQFFVRNMAKFP